MLTPTAAAASFGRLLIKTTFPKKWRFASVWAPWFLIKKSERGPRETRLNQAAPFFYSSTMAQAPHPLGRTWALWEHRKAAAVSKASAAAYGDSMHRICDFGTAEAFWEHWSHLPAPSVLFTSGEKTKPTPPHPTPPHHTTLYLTTPHHIAPRNTPPHP